MTDYSFWKWFWIGENDKPGFRSFVNWQILIYLVAIIAIYPDLPMPMNKIACSMMLPICGIIFGITFAWSGNITALLSTNELDKFSNYVPGGLETYVYYTQSVVLLVLTLGGLWGLVGFELLVDKKWYYLLLTVTAMTIRECWNLILMAQYLILVRRDVARLEHKKQNLP